MAEFKRFIVTTGLLVAIVSASQTIEAQATEGEGPLNTEVESSPLRIHALTLTREEILSNHAAALGLEIPAPPPPVDTGVRFFLSPDSTEPSLTNPTLDVAPGDSFSLYLWAQLPNTMRIPAMAITLTADTPVPVRVTDGIIDNPNIPGEGDRWSRSYMMPIEIEDDLPGYESRMIKVGGGVNGALSAVDPLYDEQAAAFRMLRYDLIAEAVGEADLYLSAGTLGIAAGIENDLIRFGFGDDPVGNSSYVARSLSALPEATIRIVDPAELRVPEPSVGLVLIAMAGPLVLRRRNQSQRFAS